MLSFSSDTMHLCLHEDGWCFCLLAAASNIVSPVAGNDGSHTGVLFPWILTAFDIKGFDFFKVLETFVPAEPKLAPEVIRVSFLCLSYIHTSTWKFHWCSDDTTSLMSSTVAVHWVWFEMVLKNIFLTNTYAFIIKLG